MPRGPRLDAPGFLHHVMGRGIERRPIFLDARDCLEFLRRLERLAKSGALSLYAWALVWNHFHLLCRTGSQPLSRSMSSLLTGYATYFNRRHERVGHLFQNRFKSVLCEDEGYFRELVRYIHLNPVRANLVAGIDELDRYPWTGHASLMQRRPTRGLDVGQVLSAFGPSPTEARDRYRRFLAEGLERGSAASSPDVQTAKHLSLLAGTMPNGKRDARVLGSAAFLERVRRSIIPRPRRHTLDPPPQRMTLAELLARVTSACGVDPAALAAGNRRAPFTRVRAGLAYLWLDVVGGDCRDLITPLGASPPSLYRAAERGRADRARWDELLRSDVPVRPGGS